MDKKIDDIKEYMKNNAAIPLTIEHLESSGYKTMAQLLKNYHMTLFSKIDNILETNIKGSS